MSVGCEAGRRKSSSHGRLAERLTAERSEKQLRGTSGRFHTQSAFRGWAGEPQRGGQCGVKGAWKNCNPVHNYRNG